MSSGLFLYLYVNTIFAGYETFTCFILFIIACLSAFSNMSSPYRDGNRTSEAYSSKDIDILNERIEIVLYKMGQAKFSIIYTIRSDRRGSSDTFDL